MKEDRGMEGMKEKEVEENGMEWNGMEWKWKADDP